MAEAMPSIPDQDSPLWNLPIPIEPPRNETPMYIMYTLLLVLSTLSVIMRLYTKVFIQKDPGLEDYFVIIGYVIWVAFTAMIYEWMHHRLSHPDSTMRDVEWYLWRIYIHSILYDAALPFVKVPILLQFIRLFSPIKRSGYIYWSCHVLIWINITKAIASALALIFQCEQRQNAWNPFSFFISNNGCVDQLLFYCISAGLNVGVDCAIILLPQRAIWALNTSMKRRLGVSALFAVGSVYVPILKAFSGYAMKVCTNGYRACGASVMRLYYSIDALSIPTTDLILAIENIGLWLGPEMACCIIASSLPMAPKFFLDIRKSRLVSNLNSFIIYISSLSTIRNIRSTPKASATLSTVLSGSKQQQHEAAIGTYHNTPQLSKYFRANGIDGGSLLNTGKH